MLTDEEVLENIKKLRSQIKESGADAFVCQLNSEDLNIDSINNFLIWDDENLLLYCITENTDLQSQMDWPIKVKSIDYRSIQLLFKLYTDSPIDH